MEKKRKDGLSVSASSNWCESIVYFLHHLIVHDEGNKKKGLRRKREGPGERKSGEKDSGKDKENRGRYSFDKEQFKARDKRGGEDREERNIRDDEDNRKGYGEAERKMQRSFCAKRALESSRGREGEGSGEFEETERQDRNIVDKSFGGVEEERHEDITGVMNLIEIASPELQEKVAETKEIRRAGKARKKIADELSTLVNSFL